MKLRFLMNPVSGMPHVYDHGVDEDDLRDVLRNVIEDRPARNNARAASGQTRAGRYLRVIYRRDPEPDSKFIITAYELQGKPLQALKKSKRGKRS